MDVRRRVRMKEAAAYDTAKFHESVFFETDEDIVAYLNAALEDGDPPFSPPPLAT